MYPIYEIREPVGNLMCTIAVHETLRGAEAHVKQLKREDREKGKESYYTINRYYVKKP